MMTRSDSELPLVLNYCKTRQQGLAALLVLGLLVGCGDATMSAVSGKVSYNGQPVTTGRISFTPVDGGRPVTAAIQADGSYRLRYSKSQEVMPIGEYSVAIISKTETRGYTHAEFEAGTVSRAELAKPPKIEWLVPEKYASAGDSGLTAKVEPGSSHFDFELE